MVDDPEDALTDRDVRPNKETPEDVVLVNAGQTRGMTNL